MPLTGNASQNIRELYADNKKSGKARGVNGKQRSRKQIMAVALSQARKESVGKMKKHKKGKK